MMIRFSLRRLFYLLLVALLALTLLGCSDDGDDDPTSPIDTSLPATLHAILCIADHEPDIGFSTSVDREAINQWLDTISQQSGMPLNRVILNGSAGNLTQTALFNTINGLAVGSNDVIVFYYSGHGGANELEGGTKWPLLVFLNNDLADFNVINDTIKGRGARFSIALADCCNNFSSRSQALASARSTGDPANYQKLFYQYSGSIVASASSPGQVSFGTDAYGGLFTYQFLQSFYSHVASANSTWDAIMNAALETIVATDGQVFYTQTPQADVSISEL